MTPAGSNTVLQVRLGDLARERAIRKMRGLDFLTQSRTKVGKETTYF